MKIVFDTYGPTVDIHIMNGKSTSGQGCAFVVYSSNEAAQNAINALNGVYSFRTDSTVPPISVAWAKGGGGPAGGGGGAVAAPAPPGYGAVPPPGFGAVAPPASLAVAAPGAPAVAAFPFGAYGVPAQVPQIPAVGALSGALSGFMGYPGLASAISGATGLTGLATPAPPPPPATEAAAPQRTKLFVGNLPVDIQQDPLRMVFGHYGRVTNVHVMQGKSKSGQSCAFVEYATSLEAETAILTLNDKYEIRPGEGAIAVKWATSGGGFTQRSSPY